MEFKLGNIGTNLKWMVFFALLNFTNGYRYYYSYYRYYRYYYSYRYYRTYYYYYYYNTYYYYYYDSSDAGVIVGGVFGGVFGFTFLTVLIILCCRTYLNSSSSSRTTGRVVMGPTVTTVATIDTEMATPSVVHVDGGMVNPTYKAEFQPPPPYYELEHPGPDVNVNHVEGVEPVGPTPGVPMAMGMPNEDPATINKNMDGNAM